MNYTNLTLFGLGALGVLLHNLVELNKLNRASKGNLKIMQYLKLEVYSIIISLVVVVGCIIAKSEIAQLEHVGKLLGLGFIAIGYLGQSLLIFGMGKANKVIGKEDESSS